LAFGALSPQGLTQVSGELGTGTQQATFNAMNLFMGVMTDPFMAGRGGDGASFIPTAYADDTTALGYAANGKARSLGARCLCRDLPQGASVGADLRSTLERLVGRLRRFADHRRQQRCRL
jgi:hypothetical protein